MTVYQSVGGQRPARRGGYYNGPTTTQIARTDKQRQAEEIGKALAAITDIPRAEFPAAAKQVAEASALPPYPVLVHHFEKQQLAGIGWFARSERKAARGRARELADAQALQEIERAEAARRAAQRGLDEAWDKLIVNDPDVVLAALAAAFEDNEAPTAATGVENGSVSLVVLIPDADEVIPDREPKTTVKGNLSLAKMTKGSRASWYRELVAGHVVVSAREAFAVAPGLVSATVLACRHDGTGIVPVVAVTVRPEDVRFLGSSGWWELLMAWDPVFRTKGVAGELQTLAADAVPGLEELTAALNGPG